MNKSKKYLALVGLGFLYSSVYLLPYLKYVFYDAMLETTGFTNAQLGYMITIYTITASISNLLTGYFADRFDAKKQLLISGYAHAVLTFIYPLFIRNYGMTLFIWGATGITSTLLFWAPIFKAVRMLGPSEEQGALYTIFEACTGISGLIGNFGAIFVFSRFASGKAALIGVIVFYGIVTLVGSVIINIMYKPDASAVTVENDSKEPAEKLSLLELLSVVKLPQVWLMGVMIFGIYGAYSIGSYLTPYCTAVLGFGAVFASVFGTIRSHGFRFVAPIGGKLADKYGSQMKVITLSTLIMTIALLVVALIYDKSSLAVLIFVLIFVFCFFHAWARGLYMSPTDEMGIPLEKCGMAITCMSVVGITGPDLFLPALCGTWLDQYGTAAYRNIFMLLAGLGLLAFVACLLLLAIKRKQQTGT